MEDKKIDQLVADYLKKTVESIPREAIDAAMMAALTRELQSFSFQDGYRLRTAIENVITHRAMELLSTHFTAKVDEIAKKIVAERLEAMNNRR